MDPITVNQVTLGDFNVATIGTAVTLTRGVKHDPIFVKNATGRIKEFRDGNVQVTICGHTKSVSPEDLKLAAIQ